MEHFSTTRKANVLFGTCYNSSYVQPPPLDSPPAVIQELFTNQDSVSKEFYVNIWQYNNMFAFTSLGVLNRRIVTHNHQGSGPYSFWIQGELYHWSGSLALSKGAEPAFVQLYIYDPATILEAQHQTNSGCNPLTLQTLQDVLLDSYPYATIYHHAHELLLQDGSAECSIKLHCIGDK